MANMKVLNIFLNNIEIGTIACLPGDRNLFTFNQNYIDDQNRDTLSLAFKDIYGQLITEIRPTQTRLPQFFSNLLPEGMLRTYLAKQAGVKPEQEFYMLWKLGHDLPGAIQAIPAQQQAWPVDIENNLDEVNAPLDTDDIFYFSLAGIQLKFSAIKENEKSLTIPVNGVGGRWIVKLPDARYSHVPENEYSMMELARAVGINVPKTMLLAAEQIHGLPSELQKPGEMAFAIKRFDRGDDAKLIHIEDFAQILNVYPEKKYGHANYTNIAKIIWKETGTPGIIEFTRRLVYNILIGNGDMHLKNWSVIYPDGITPELAPAYDFVSTVPYIKNDSLALNLVGNKSFDSVNIKSFYKLAAKAALPEKVIIETVFATLDAFAENWQHVTDFGLSNELKKTIENHLQIIPLWNERKKI